MAIYEKLLGWSERLALLEKLMIINPGATLTLESQEAAGIASILREISAELPDVAELIAK